MKMMKLFGIAACVLALGLVFCGKDKGNNPGVPLPTVYDYSDTVALRALLDANGLFAISAGTPTGNPPTLVMTLQDGNMHRIKELRLTNKGITTITPHIGQLTAMTMLLLDTNAISSLPPEIGQCTSLVMLQVTNNQLATLPTEIGSLHNLQTLKLSHNVISSLPAGLWTITALTQLKLDYNQLTALPAEVSNLALLTVFWLNNNVLTTLPLAMRQSPALDAGLEMLEISGNSICPATLNALDATFAGWVDKRDDDWRTTQVGCP